jgi:hypothetical protein
VPQLVRFDAERGAQRPRMSSMTIMPCGPPKPRNAVFDGRFVLAIRPVTSMSGIQ